MDQNTVKITDIITTEYADFLSYCFASGKVFTLELTNVDYIAFRTSSGQSREYIKTIRNMIENPVIITPALPDNNSNAFQEQEETEPELSEKVLPSVVEESVPALSFDGCNTNQSVEDVTSDPEIIVDSKPATLSEGINQSLPIIAQTSKASSAEKTPSTTEESTKEEVSKIDIPSDSQYSLAYLFGAEASDFSDINVEQLYLSVRASNCLKNAKYITLEDVLNKTVVELQGIRNMGVKSVNEIVQKVKDFVSNPANINSIAQSKTESILIDGKLKAAVEALLTGEKYTTDGMTDAQIEHFEKMKSATLAIGEEICLEAYLNPQYGVQICNMLLEFASPYIQYKRVIEEAIHKIGLLSDSMQRRKAIPFIKAYEAKAGEKLSYLLSECKDDTTISKIPYLYEIFRKEENMLTLTTETNKFLSWLSFDVNELIVSISENIRKILSGKNERSLEVFSLRADGKTLEEIGVLYGVTRERVRQIEAKVYRTFWSVYSKQKYDLIMLVYALRDGDAVLYFKELKELLGDFADTLWACIRHNPDQELYYYSKALDAVVVRSSESVNMDEVNLLSKINEAIETLPELIEKGEKDNLLLTLLSKSAFPLEVLENIFEDTYNLSGIFYHKGHLTVVTMCSYVLKHRFSAGFKTADAFEADRFRQYMVEFFGEKGASITNRAIDAKIGDVGILCDRGKYIHPDFMQVDQSIIDAINDYVEKSPRSLLPYGEIYEAMKDILEGTQITNRYLLQGALKKYGCRFSTGRDFIRKIQSVTLVDELESFVEERGIVHKAEIFAEFTSIGEAGLGQVVARSTNVFNIDNGYYIHASQFDIQPEDYEYLREYLRTACQDIPVNIRSVHEAVALQFPEFMYRNDFENRNKLFAALNYMFRGEFSFSRPYVAKLGVNDISNRSVILQHIEEYDSIEIKELIDICEENSIHYVAVSYLFQMLVPEYIRVNRSTLMKKEYTGITDEVVTKTVEIILNMLETNDYIVGSKIDDFLWFPQIDVDWNEFLLENLIIQSKQVNIVYLIGDPLKHPNAVYVSDKYQKDTFDSLLLKILTDEVRKGSFTSKVEMREWLKEEGFIEGKLPNFLESAKYFYVNETGVHCTGE